MPRQICQHSQYITGAARYSYLVYLTIKDRGLVEKEVELRGVQKLRDIWLARVTLRHG